MNRTKVGTSVAVALALSAAVASAQSKPVVVMPAFTAAPGVALPYDLGLLQTQLVAELKVVLGNQFDVAADAPTGAPVVIYTLEGEITGWRAGNAAKRLLVGLGSGRESLDLRYRIADGAGKSVFERKDTIRTNFYSQAAGSTGTLAHPIAQKIAERIRNAKLK